MKQGRSDRASEPSHVSRPASPVLRVAMIGCGMAGQFHARALEWAGPARLVSVTDTDEAAARRSSARWAVPARPLECVVGDDEVDALGIATPSNSHARIATTALAHGKHVLIEKPLDKDLLQARQVVLASARHGRLAAVTYQHRLSPDVERFRRALERTRLRPFHATAIVHWNRDDHYYQGAQGTWADSGGGALMNQGIHYLDLLRYLMGDPVTIFARMGTMARRIEVEDSALVMLGFADGASAVLHTSTVHPTAPVRMGFAGNGWAVEFEDDAIVEVSTVAGCSLRLEAAGAPTPAVEELLSGSAHARVWENFAAAVAGVEPLIADVRDAYKTQELADRCYRAAGFGPERPMPPGMEPDA